MTARPADTEAHGLTLIELMIVVVILVALAGLLVPLFGGVAESAREDAARATLRRVQEVIVGSAGMPRYVADVGELPRPGDLGNDAGREPHPQLRYLFVNPRFETGARSFDPDAGRGWRGPYLAHRTGAYTVDDVRGFTRHYGETGDAAVVDPWGNPLVIEMTTTPEGDMVWVLTSAGADGSLLTDDDNVSVELRRD